MNADQVPKLGSKLCKHFYCNIKSFPFIDSQWLTKENGDSDILRGGDLGS